MTEIARTTPPAILALGVGNTLLSDEAAGPRAVARFEEHCPDLHNLTCLDAGTLSFTLAETIGAAEGLIVFDAARLGQEPGTVKVLEGEAMDAFVRSGKLTVHEVGLADLLDMARVTGDLPPRRALVAIEPGEIGWGLSLSAEVEAAMDIAAEAARQVALGWLRAPAPVDPVPVDPVPVEPAP